MSKMNLTGLKPYQLPWSLLQAPGKNPLLVSSSFRGYGIHWLIGTSLQALLLSSHPLLSLL